VGPTATLLLDTADAFSSTGLLGDGYRYIIATEGWNLANRTAVSDELQPSPSFTNSSVRALSNQLHAKGFKFGIYGAAAFTTCAHRAGSLYHERQDALWYRKQGVDYLKYDDCGEANIQSYSKYFVMKDALAAAPGGGLDYYSFEPFQIYAAGAVEQMAWVSEVGDLWRSSNDIRPVWKSVLSNAFLTNKWAPNARPGHYNDADELEIGSTSSFVMSSFYACLTTLVFLRAYLSVCSYTTHYCCCAFQTGISRSPNSARILRSGA
jgi:alpha-galactosidase